LLDCFVQVRQTEAGFAGAGTCENKRNRTIQSCRQFFDEFVAGRRRYDRAAFGIGQSVRDLRFGGIIADGTMTAPERNPAKQASIQSTPSKIDGYRSPSRRPFARQAGGNRSRALASLNR